MDVIVGVALLPLSYLSYMIAFQDEDPLTVIDYMASSCGYLKMELLPCDPSGRERSDLSVNDPSDLVRFAGQIFLFNEIISFLTFTFINVMHPIAQPIIIMILLVF